MQGSDRIACELVVPDASPLITLAYAGRLDLLLVLGIKIVVVDMVKIELTRHPTPTSYIILDFLVNNHINIIETDTGKEAVERGESAQRKHEGERAIQDFLFEFHDKTVGIGGKNVLLLFEDNKIAGTAFVLPDNVYLLSTKSFLFELQRRGLIPSAEEIMNEALAKGRECSQHEVDRPPKVDSFVLPFPFPPYP